MSSKEDKNKFLILLDKSQIQRNNKDYKNMRIKYLSKPNSMKSFQKNSEICNKSMYDENQGILANQNQISLYKRTKQYFIEDIYIGGNKNSKEVNSKNPFLKKMNQKKNTQEENIEEEDTEEFQNGKLNININVPKLPYNYSRKNNHYFKKILKNVNTKIDILDQSAKILSNKSHLNENIDKTEIKNKNNSCIFINKNSQKSKLNKNISVLNSKIELLKVFLNKRNIQILNFQIFFEGSNLYKKKQKSKILNDIDSQKLKNNIFFLKSVKSWCEEKYIKINDLKKRINKEEELFKIKKAEIIEKLLNYKILLFNNNRNSINSANYNSNNYNEEATINNESIIYENDYACLDSFERLELAHKKKECSILINEKNKSQRDNIKNNDSKPFIISTIGKNKSKPQLNSNMASLFNIAINANNVK